MNIQNNSNSPNFKNYEFEKYRPSEPRNLMRSIILHDAPAGAGKTYGICKVADLLVAYGERVLVVQPTKELIAKTINEIRAKINKNMRITRIDGDVSPRVIADISGYFRDADEEGQVLFITHNAFEQIPYFHRSDNWNLIIDETPQIHSSFKLNCKKTHQFLTSILITEQIDENWSRLTIADQNGVSSLENDMKSDDNTKSFKKVLAQLKSDHWRVYVNTEQYLRYVSNDPDTKSHPVLYSEMKPSIVSGFKTVRIAGAQMKDSLLYKLWGQANVEFFDEQLIDMRYSEHINGERIQIFYAIKGFWSQQKRKRLGEEIWEPLLAKTRELSDGKDFLYLGNIITGSLFPYNDNAIRLPSMPHGLNQFTDVNMVAFLASYNPSPQLAAFLRLLGLNDEDIQRDMYYVKAYQAILRGGIRNPEKTEKQIVVVPDHGLAEWLQSILKGSKVEWLGFGPAEGGFKPVGRPAIHEDSAARKRSFRARESTKDHLALWKELLEQITKQPGDAFLDRGEYCDEIHYVKIGNVPNFRACIWESYSSTTSSRFVVSSSSDLFIEKLRECHQRTIPSKIANQVMTMGCPVPKLKNMRRQENMICANGIMLDNDGGDLTPDEFSALFTHTEMVIYNTYSSTSLDRRWRAYIPTEFIMTPPMYKNVIEQIFKAVEKEGYNAKGTDGKKKDGFDRSKKGAADLMFLPCQAAEKGASFFLEFRGPERTPLDPTQWINFDEEPEIVQDFVLNSSSSKKRKVDNELRQAEIDFEIERWRIGDVDKKRNDAYSTMYYALKRKGIFKNQIIRIMTEEALLCKTKKLVDARLSQLQRMLKGSNR